MRRTDRSAVRDWAVLEVQKMDLPGKRRDSELLAKECVHTLRIPYGSEMIRVEALDFKPSCRNKQNPICNFEGSP